MTRVVLETEQNYYFMKNLFLLILSVLIFSCSQEDYCPCVGQVTSISNGIPIEGAQVILEIETKFNCSFSFGCDRRYEYVGDAFTNSLGEFSIDIPDCELKGRYTIRSVVHPDFSGLEYDDMDNLDVRNNKVDIAIFNTNTYAIFYDDPDLNTAEDVSYEFFRNGRTISYFFRLYHHPLNEREIEIIEGDEAAYTYSTIIDGIRTENISLTQEEIDQKTIVLN